MGQGEARGLALPAAIRRRRSSADTSSSARCGTLRRTAAGRCPTTRSITIASGDWNFEEAGVAGVRIGLRGGLSESSSCAGLRRPLAAFLDRMSTILQPDPTHFSAAYNGVDNVRGLSALGTSQIDRHYVYMPDPAHSQRSIAANVLRPWLATGPPRATIPRSAWLLPRGPALGAALCPDGSVSTRSSQRNVPRGSPKDCLVACAPASAGDTARRCNAGGVGGDTESSAPLTSGESAGRHVNGEGRVAR